MHLPDRWTVRSFLFLCVASVTSAAMTRLLLKHISDMDTLKGIQLYFITIQQNKCCKTVSAQAMCLYSQPTQARNPVRRGSPPSYHSVSNHKRKDSCSQRPRLLNLHIYRYMLALTLTQPPIPDPAPNLLPSP